MERFLHRRRDGRILDVDEFQVAKALLAGETELLSGEVDSGEHLFDLCCQFGHESTAAAMISYRVPGSVFKGSHSLRPPPAVEPPYPPEPVRMNVVCQCVGWKTCRGCSWGVSDQKRGLWMEDWDASLQDAKSASESSAAGPLVRALLEAFRSQASVEGIARAEAMAYLLDVAILLGDAELARCCAKHCTRLPLRRWRSDELVRIFHDRPFLRAEIREKDVLIAALAAGLELEHLEIHAFWYGSVSLAEALVLSADAELWHRVEGLQLQLGPWPTHEEDNIDMAGFLLERSGGQVGLSSERLHRAKRAGLPLSSFEAGVPFRCHGCGGHDRHVRLSLLDLAILFGQNDCSRLCGPMDIVATKFTLRASLEAMPLEWEDEEPCYHCGSTSLIRDEDSWAAQSIASLPERRAAAAEALRTALQASRRKTASSAGFGLFQAMQCWARGKRVPAALVNLVLTFAAERPSLLQALEGREGELPPLSHWWEESGQDGASQSQQAADPCVQAGPSSSANGGDTSVAAASSATINTDTPNPDVKPSADDDLMIALRNSKSDMPPLSPEGAVVFRLSRQNNAPRVNDVLLDATGPLAELHMRVLEAGCEVAPKWSPVKALFIPVTEPQMQELLHSESGRYELGRTHILALLSDFDLIDRALRQLPKITRPKLRRDLPKEHGEGDAEAAEEVEEDAPMIVLEGEQMYPSAQVCGSLREGRACLGVGPMFLFWVNVDAPPPNGPVNLCPYSENGRADICRAWGYCFLIAGERAGVYKQAWPAWALMAMGPLLRKRRDAKRREDSSGEPEHAEHAYDAESGAGMRRRLILHEAQHTAPSADEETPLTTPRKDEEELEADAAGGDAAAEDEEGGGGGELSKNFRELMQYSAEDRKAENFVPLAGNMYRYFGLGIVEDYMTVQSFGMMTIFFVQLLSPPACLVQNLYKMDWEHWHFGVSDWIYMPGSNNHGISNLSKHVVATLFLIMFCLNGAMVIEQDRVVSMKISSMLDQIGKDMPDYLKEVKFEWLYAGRIMNCLVVIECSVIVYFAFVLSETPMDVLFNSMAVTFLYNLDDIGGEMGFLGDDDWDGEELGKLYFNSVSQLMDDKGITEAGFDPDTIAECKYMRNYYSHWAYKVAEPLMYALTVVLPLMYVFIDDLHCKPGDLKVEVYELKKQAAPLLLVIGCHRVQERRVRTPDRGQNHPVFEAGPVWEATGEWTIVELEPPPRTLYSYKRTGKFQSSSLEHFGTVPGPEILTTEAFLVIVLVSVSGIACWAAFARDSQVGFLLGNVYYSLDGPMEGYDSSYERELRTCRSPCPKDQGETATTFSEEVKQGEGFNLQREIFPRVGWVVSRVNEALRSACARGQKCAEWALVLPPWCRWERFFDAAALRSANVTIMDRFTNDPNSCFSGQRGSLPPPQQEWLAEDRGLGFGDSDPERCDVIYSGTAHPVDLRWEVTYSGSCDGGVVSDFVDLVLVAMREGARSVTWRISRWNRFPAQGYLGGCFDQTPRNTESEAEVLLKAADSVSPPAKDEMDALGLRQAMLFAPSIRDAGERYMTEILQARPFLAVHCVTAKVYVATDAPDELREQLRSGIRRGREA
ncbi:POFUT2 [Symbiodinium sp. CCMP2456]|nr:POFUT2 [Symbiodinium sp. CCMP2456]